jgi:hypothetical protein
VSDAWQWLVAHGLREAFVSWLVFFGLGTIFIGVAKKVVKRELHLALILLHIIATTNREIASELKPTEEKPT